MEPIIVYMHLFNMFYEITACKYKVDHTFLNTLHCVFLPCDQPFGLFNQTINNTECMFFNNSS